MHRYEEASVSDKLLFDRLFMIFTSGYINIPELESKLHLLFPLDKIKIVLDGEIQGRVIGLDACNGTITQYNAIERKAEFKKGQLRIEFDGLNSVIESPIWKVLS